MSRSRGLVQRVVLTACLTLASGTASADAVTELLRSKQCLGCHQVNVKRVGPAFAHIAKRYVTMSGAMSYIADTIQHGSRQKWGAVPMPAQPHVSDVDAVIIATWILSLAQQP